MTNHVYCWLLDTPIALLNRHSKVVFVCVCVCVCVCVFVGVTARASHAICSLFFFQPLPMRYTHGGGQKNLHTQEHQCQHIDKHTHMNTHTHTHTHTHI